MSSAIKNAGENRLTLLYTGPTSGMGVIKPSELLALIQPYYGSGKTIHFVNVERASNNSSIAMSLVPVDVLVDDMTTINRVNVYIKNDVLNSATLISFVTSTDNTNFTNVEGDLSIYVL